MPETGILEDRWTDVDPVLIPCPCAPHPPNGKKVGWSYLEQLNWHMPVQPGRAYDVKT